VIFIALILDVLAYHGFIAMLSNRACEKTIRPKFATPQLFLDLGATPEYLSRRHALQHSHDLRHTVSRYRLNQKMNMILVCAYLQKLHLVAFRNFQTYLFQNFINPVVKHCSSVLCRKYQVVHQHRYVVALVDIFAHPQSLRRKRRGIQPEEIKSSVRPELVEGLAAPIDWYRFNPIMVRQAHHERIKSAFP
jgi:hypothetical protein